MRLSITRSGIAAVAAAIALSACGGQGIVPSQSAPSGSLVGQEIASVTSPCAAKTLPFYFHGSCTTATLTSKGNTVSLKPYKGIAFKIQLGANNAKGTLAFIVGDATGVGDITGKIKFPLYSTKTCQKGNTCPGKSLIYIEAASSSKAAITLNGNSFLTISATKFPGKGCWPAVLTKTGWNTRGAILIMPPKGHVVKIMIPGGGLFSLPAGAAYIDIVCS
jgi:hypothetical protein